MSATRRERQRAATIDEIKEAAVALIASEGPAGLSIRGVARAIGMSPAGLYRYFDGLDDLLTALIADAYGALADHVAAASGEGAPRDRLGAAMLAYREWCLGNRDRFLLIYGTPIPGYAAPEGGPTEQASRRIGEVFFGIVMEAWRRGELAVPSATRPPDALEREHASRMAPGFPPELLGTFLSTWAHFHGLVTLEVLNQLCWVYPDAGAFYRGEVERILDRSFGGQG
ncbi:MAG: TetR/AcrR family transcriptional regulator [Actinobacteria bacterium]|nr:TetR/AcrR family transcriptional regulator [Actinomycetota bacterium]